MEKKMLYYSLPLFGHTFKGLVYNFSQLSAKFQIWARQYGVSDEPSLGMWVAGTNHNYGEQMDEAAKASIHLLPNEGVVDLTNIS